MTESEINLLGFCNIDAWLSTTDSRKIFSDWSILYQERITYFVVFSKLCILKDAVNSKDVLYSLKDDLVADRSLQQLPRVGLELAALGFREKSVLTSRPERWAISRKSRSRRGTT